MNILYSLLCILDSMPAKIAALGIIGGAATIGDAVMNNNSIEDLTLKVAMGITILFLVGIVYKLYLENKEERRRQEEEREDREDKLSEALQNNTKAWNSVEDLIRKQTNYFENITKVIIDQHIHKQ